MKLFIAHFAQFVLCALFCTACSTLPPESESGCSTAIPVNASLEKEFELPFGNYTAQVASTSVSVCIDSVLSDSRCPTGAVCVWAGSAAVRLSVYDATSKTRQVMTLNTNQSPKELVFQGYRVAIVDVMPYPRLSVQTKASEYKVRLLVLAK
jgi:hypothetical protein